MDIYNNFSLKRYNSFGIDAKAKYYINITKEEQLLELFGTQEYQSSKHYVIGGGSNILFRNDFDGLIINIELGGLKLVEINPEFAIMKVGAGENWHSFVETSTKNRYYGIENLAMIPGKVGAAPVQNIGAYGVEQKDYFHSLQGIIIETGEKIILDKNDCNFGYRNSIFKNELLEKVIITDVFYKLDRQWEINLSYKELQTELEKFAFIKQDIDYVFNTIIRVRETKLPNPKTLGNAGSFFKNPIIDAELYGRLFAQHIDIPAYQIDSQKVKIPAAWLIEKCGWKGYRSGDAGVFEKHSLILVNHGNASGEDIFQLSEQIIDSVKEKFDIELQREVVVL